MLVALHRKSSFISIAVVVSEKSTLATKHAAHAAGCPTTLNYVITISRHSLTSHYHTSYSTSTSHMLTTFICNGQIIVRGVGRNRNTHITYFSWVP